MSRTSPIPSLENSKLYVLLELNDSEDKERPQPGRHDGQTKHNGW